MISLVGGKNFCTLCRGFSSKSLGPDADIMRTNVCFSSFYFPTVAAC
jgi:hypothetical protein